MKILVGLILLHWFVYAEIHLCVCVCARACVGASDKMSKFLPLTDE